MEMPLGGVPSAWNQLKKWLPPTPYLTLSLDKNLYIPEGEKDYVL